MTLEWLGWAQRLQAIAQNGLTYAADPFDIERYAAVRRIAAELLASRADVPAERVHDLFAGETGYATPKIDVRGAVFHETGEAILLVKERRDGKWTLPGGWADIGESPGEAVAREVLEESGYRVRATKLLAFYDRNKHGHPPLPFHTYKVFFRCEVIGVGAWERGAEIADRAFFPEHDLPELSLSRVTPAQIARLFQHRRHPNWPTDFD